jgi:hypothetical protein
MVDIYDGTEIIEMQTSNTSRFQKIRENSRNCVNSFETARSMSQSKPNRLTVISNNLENKNAES